MQGWGQQAQQAWQGQGGWQQGGQQPQQQGQQQSWQQPQQQAWQQQQARAQQPVPAGACGAQMAQARPGAGAAEVGAAQRFSIGGCKHDVVGPIIRGDYVLAGSNHGKPAYKKENAANGLVVMIYFWDERDGASSSGWWIGPQIGGNMVWGHHPNRASATPPTSGWQAPHSAPADPSIVVTIGGAGAAGQAGTPQSAQQQMMQQQQQQQQQQQASWMQQQQQAPQQAQQQSWMQQGQQDQSWSQQKGGAQQGQSWNNQQGKGGAWAAQQQQYQQEQIRKQQEQMQAARLKQQQMEEQRRQLEEANKQRIAQQQAKIAEQKRIQEELQRKKIEEQRARMEEMRQKQAETKACASVRKSLLKLKIAVPENFDALKEEVAKMLAAELDACGSQKAAVQEEADKAIDEASKKVEGIKEQRAKAEAARVEAAKKKQEAIDKARALLLELKGLAEAAEEASKDFAEMTAGFSEKPGLDSEDKVSRAAQPIEEAGTEAVSKLQACHDFLKAKTADLRPLPQAPKPMLKKAAAKPEEGTEEPKEEAPAELTQADLQKVQSKITSLRSANDKEARSLKQLIQAANKKAAAASEMKKIQTLFNKYDKDKDAHLSKKEITVFAKSEYKYTIPEDDLGKMLKVLVQDGAKGVKATDFQALKAAIGVSRERTMDKDRKVAREAREKEVAEQKAELQKSMEGVVAALKEAEQAVAEVGKAGRTLMAEAKSLKATAMLSKAAEVETAVQEASEKVAAVFKDIESCGADAKVDEDLTNWFQAEKKKLTIQGKTQEAACGKTTQLLEKFKADANRKDSAEVKVLAAKALEALKKYKADKTLTAGALFDEVAKGAESFGPDEFAAFMCGLPKAEAEDGKEAAPEPESEDWKRAFKQFDEDKTGLVTKQILEAILMVLMKVVKDVAMTESMGIKDTKTVRRLEVGEVVQILEGPIKEETMDVLRVRVKALKDDAEGWTTVAGNQGSMYLKEGVSFKVIKETILTEGFEIEVPKEEARKIQQSTRKLKPGEIVELRVWGRKQEDTGLTRMKIKVKSDGTVGYVTSVGNTGIKFVEIV